MYYQTEYEHSLASNQTGNHLNDDTRPNLDVNHNSNVTSDATQLHARYITHTTFIKLVDISITL